MTTNQETSLRERCAELAEWWDTGILRDGHLRQLAASLARYAEDERIRAAERQTEQEAVRAMAARAEPQAGDDFADWLAREMPPGTVISNPHWWAPRILRQIAAPSPASLARPEAQGEADQYECRVILRDGFGEWHKCSREQYDHIRLTGFYNGPGGAQCEARALYATPPADRAPGEVGEDAIEVLEGLHREMFAAAASSEHGYDRWQIKVETAIAAIRRFAARAPSAPAAGDGDALRRELIRVYRSIGNDLMAAEHEAALIRRLAALEAQASAPGGEVMQFIQDCADGLPEWKPGECRKRAIALASRTGKGGVMERYFLKQAMSGNRADSYMVADPSGLWVMAADAEARIRELEQQLTAARAREVELIARWRQMARDAVRFDTATGLNIAANELESAHQQEAARADK